MIFCIYFLTRAEKIWVKNRRRKKTSFNKDIIEPSKNANNFKSCTDKTLTDNSRKRLETHEI